MTIGQPERVTQNRVVAPFRDELRYRTEAGLGEAREQNIGYFFYSL